MAGKTQDAINAQINHELFSAYLYLAIAIHLSEKGLSGFAKWMRAQSAEEQEHAMRLIGFMDSVGGKVALEAIPPPRFRASSAKEVLDAVLAHEKKISGDIHKLYETASSEKDYPAAEMLRWFISEQVEEEEKVRKLIDRLAMAGEGGAALLEIDRELESGE